MQKLLRKNFRKRVSVLAVIPARGGSKGIPRKNIVELCGRPLVAWSIEAGNDLVKRGVVHEAVVSTDDTEIAEVAKKWGGKVPFLRPPALSTDQAKTVDVLIHALDWFAGRDVQFDAVLLLQPTSPQRDLFAIEKAVRKFFQQAHAQSLIACFQDDYICDAVMYQRTPGGYLKPKSPSHNLGSRRQDTTPVWIRTGALYLTLSEFLRSSRKIICDHPMLFEMKKSQSVDLNSPEDLELLRAILCRSES